MSRGRPKRQSQTSQSSAGHPSVSLVGFPHRAASASWHFLTPGPVAAPGRVRRLEGPGRLHGPAALPTSLGRAALLINAHSLLLQQQAYGSRSSPPSECLTHTMDSRATGFCSSGSSSGNEGNYHIPVPLLAAINLSQKNGPWRQLLQAA